MPGFNEYGEMVDEPEESGRAQDSKRIMPPLDNRALAHEQLLFQVHAAIAHSFANRRNAFQSAIRAFLRYLLGDGAFVSKDQTKAIACHLRDRCPIIDISGCDTKVGCILNV